MPSPMKPGSFLQKAKALPVRPLADVVRLGGIVILAPHPDDESIGCGGLIAEACRLAIACRVIFLSDGTGSHPNSKAYPPKRLRARREEEACRATAVLGLPSSSLRFLRLADCGVPASGASAEWAIAEIAAVIRESDASTLFVTSHHDPHCDHQASYEIACGVLRQFPCLHLYAYPIWAWRDAANIGMAGDPAGFRLWIEPHLDKKRMAILQHESQAGDLIQDDPTGFHLEPAMLEEFLRPYEVFLDASVSP